MSKPRRTSPAVQHDDDTASMTTPEGVRIVISTASLQSNACRVVHIEPKHDARTPEQIKAELEKQKNKRRRIKIKVPKRRKAKELDWHHAARFV